MPDDLDKGFEPSADHPSDEVRPDDDPFDPWEGEEPEEVWPELWRPSVAKVIADWAGRDPGASNPIYAAIRAAIADGIGEDLPGWRARVVGDDVYALQPGPVPPQVPPGFALRLGPVAVDVYAIAYADEAFDDIHGGIVRVGGYMLHVVFLGSVELADPGMFDQLARLLLWPEAKPSESEWCPRDDIRDAIDGIHQLLHEYDSRCP